MMSMSIRSKAGRSTAVSCERSDSVDNEKEGGLTRRIVVG